ncbi:MAG: propionyl-CoA synthetase [Candidatus Nanopelagicales bacterium]|nr:propionyl-CoA synthetase [Candidatus Nanopelagicales bacterium]
MVGYYEVRKQWEANPIEFWQAAANRIDWIRAPKEVLDESRAPIYHWYPDGVLNTCTNALDRHVVLGRGDQIAIYYDSPLTESKRAITYQELLDQVSLFAGGLASLGVHKGARVLIYMPMIPEAAVAMLACARLGAVHSVVFGGFAAAELAARIDDAEPAVIVMASCGIEPGRIVEYQPIVEEAIHLARHKPTSVVVLQRPQSPAVLGEHEIEWHDLLATATRHDPVPVHANDPLYILYTSGTTGKPKGVVRDNGGHAVAMAWSFTNVYGMGPGDVWWAASDIGWVVGHSYIVYAPLICGATTVMYEGKPVGTPDAGAFWRVIEEYQVNGLFVAPTAIRAIRKEDSAGSHLLEHDIKSLRTLFLAGERLDPSTFEWASEHLGIPVVDNWWQTESGWPIASNLRGLDPMPIKSGSPSVIVPGYDVQIFDVQGNVQPPGTEGEIVIKLPMPPGTLPTLWGDDQRFIDSYLSAFPGYYTTGDGGYFDDEQYLHVMGRTDDVINVAGHRLSTGSMEAVVSANPMVAECAVIGVHDEIKGQIPRAFVVLKVGVEVDPMVLRNTIVAAVRDEIGPVAALKEVVIVPALPKTRSGKILRATMRGIADGREVVVPSTIEDVGVLEAITPLLQGDSASD